MTSRLRCLPRLERPTWPWPLSNELITNLRERAEETRTDTRSRVEESRARLTKLQEDLPEQLTELREVHRRGAA